MPPSGATTWPSIPLEGWEEARQSFHLYTQVVGKVALANAPVVNHWWSSTLRVTARGLRTPMLFHPTGGAFQIEFDLVAHRLDVLTTGGERRSLPLEDRSVAAFHDAVLTLLDDLGVATEIWPVPVEIADAIPFTEDHEHVRYDPDAVLLEFLQATYEAAATSAAWDREALERPTGPHDDT